jgi:hypothetical protein
LSYKKYLAIKKKNKKETSREVKEAIKENINLAKNKKLKILEEFNKRIINEQ